MSRHPPRLMGLPAAYRKARPPRTLVQVLRRVSWHLTCAFAAPGDARGHVPGANEQARHAIAPRAGHSHRALCKGSPTPPGAAIPLGREPRNGTEWTMMPPSLRGANTGFLTRRRVNGGADGPWASRAERSPAREAHWPAPRQMRDGLAHLTLHLAHLTLHTGTFNTSARSFQAARGFAEEELCPTRPASRPLGPPSAQPVANSAKFGRPWGPEGPGGCQPGSARVMITRPFHDHVDSASNKLPNSHDHGWGAVRRDVPRETGTPGLTRKAGAGHVDGARFGGGVGPRHDERPYPRRRKRRQKVISVPNTLLG
jgi:hypothetical protein